jgi:arylsulfatase A-like enzyme
VTLSLETESDVDGAVALWAAPTLSGTGTSDRPNVIFYIIDGASAKDMSVYGYNRSTTPNLERIAAEGAVFEYAYCNSSWTKTSTPSFMTSLQHSVLGGYRDENDPLPDQVVTMAQHLHGAGYQTAVFTTNPYAGIMSSFDRGVDALREAGVEPNSASSRVLHDDFWSWREAYPAQPYWVHFQTTDVHWPRVPQPPVAGIFVDPERRARYLEWERRMGLHPGAWQTGRFDERVQELGIDQAAFFDVLRGLYDETMAHQDYQLGRLVERLKSSGEWENTLLIVAADHGTSALVGVLDPEIERNSAARFHWGWRIPMIIVWPERIASGQRFSQPVSMIDMLPTILDLAGLPMPEIYQGQSLAPLLLGEDGWEPRPVIIDEFYVSDPETGEMSGDLAMIDGRWLAWLNVRPSSADTPPEDEPPRLTLWDRWAPYGGKLNEERPDLVDKYTRLLEERWRSHQALGEQFTRSGGALLTPEQLRTLKSLGYIQ